MPVPKVLVIAGSDSSGGAGLEADQKTLAAHGVYAMTATTALTAQSTLGVEDVHVTPPAFVEKQIRCVLDDMGVEVIKMGMLASSDTVITISQTLEDYRQKSGNGFKIVLDPVMVSTSGAQLLPGDAVRNLRTRLIPSTFVLTPNIPEATLLLRDADIQCRSPSSLEDLKSLAKQVHSLGPHYVLLKGGHMALNKHTNLKASSSDSDLDKIVVDILFSQLDGEDRYEIITQPFLSSPNTHGTGCSLASAIAAGLASHLTVSPTISSSILNHIIRSSITYVSQGISTSTTLALSNRGSGPINHFHSILPSLFPPQSFIDYLLSHPSITSIWHRYTHHPFTHALATATLPSSSFKTYLIQDYLYLTHFARTYSLAGYKSPSIATTVYSAHIILHIRKEMDLHLSFCRDSFDLTQTQIESTPESLVCTAYSRYVLDIGMSGDLLALYVALAPCLIGYGQVARRIYDEHMNKQKSNPSNNKEEALSPYKDASQGNKYWRWIENYVADDYQQAVKEGRELIEEMVERQGLRGARGKIDELVEIFRRATEMEVQFWEV